MLDEIRKRIIESELTPNDLRIVLDILDEVKKEVEHGKILYPALPARGG
jgi:hypothetical protein